MNNFKLLGVLLLSVVLFGCTEDIGPVTPDTPAVKETGTLILHITDQPLEGLKALNVTISKIEIRLVPEKGENEWVVFSEEEKAFDLMQLSGVTGLLGEKERPVGKYTQIRLTVKSAEVVLEDDSVHATEIPGGTVKLVKAFEIREGKTTELVLDFRPESVKKAGPNYVMTPVIKVLTMKEFREMKQEHEMFCGDGECGEGENHANCKPDCSFCGGEDAAECPEGFNCVLENPEEEDSTGVCVAEGKPEPVCGNGEKEAGENCITCAEDMPEGACERAKGKLELKITDKPFGGEYTAINVTISAIEVHKAEEKWFTFSEEKQGFDLLQLSNVSELLGEKELEVGHYTQIRLVVSEAAVTVDANTGDTNNDNGVPDVNTGNGDGKGNGNGVPDVNIPDNNAENKNDNNAGNGVPDVNIPDNNAGNKNDNNAFLAGKPQAESGTFDVRVPSEKIRLVRQFEIREGETTTLVLDFRPESVHFAGGQYILTPTIKVLTQEQFEDIELCGNGQLDEEETCYSCPEDVQCAEGELCCEDSCIVPECTEDGDCDDGLETTTDHCINAGECSAACKYTENPIPSEQ